MKTISAVMSTGLILVITIINSFAQSVPDKKATFVNPYHVAITYNKTTNLVFPYAIKSIDRGTKDVLVQKAIGVENILQVKAAKQGFPETNLTVVTADGSLYTYLLTYADTPSNLNYLFSNPEVRPHPSAVFDQDATTDIVALKAKEAAGRERVIANIKDKNYEIQMDVKGVYIHEDVLYFQLTLTNNSAINYDVQSLRFFILDKKKSKRTAAQEIDLDPVYELGNVDVIRHNSEQTVCIALPKFTIPDKKFLNMQLIEKNGGRNLLIKISNKTLIRSKTLL